MATPDAPEPSDPDGPVPRSRRTVLRAAGAGAVAGGGLALPASAGAQDVVPDRSIGEEFEWEADLHERVRSYDVSTERIDPAELTPRPEVTVEPDRVVIVGTRQFSVTGCDTVRPLAVGYDSLAEELTVDVVDVHLPDHLDRSIGCAEAVSQVRFELTIELEDLTPASVRVAEFPTAEAVTRPDLTVAYPGEESLPLPEGVEDYEFDVLEDLDPDRLEEPPSVEWRGDEVVATGAVKIGSSACKRLALERLDATMGVLRATVQDVPDHAGGDCTPDIAAVGYELRVTIDDSSIISGASVLEAGHRDSYRAAAGDGRDVSSATDYVREHALSVRPAADADPSAEPTVEFADGEVTVEGAMPAAAVRRETLALEHVGSTFAGERVTATLADRSRSVAPSVALGGEYAEERTVAYELTVGVPDDGPSRATVVEESISEANTTEVLREGRAERVVPQDLTVIARTPEAVTLDWAPMAAATVYEVTVGDEASVRTESAHVRVDGLAPDTAYEVTVRGIDDPQHGGSSVPATLEVTTPPAVDEYPADIDVALAGSGAAGDDDRALAISLSGMESGAAVESVGLDVTLPSGAEVTAVPYPYWHEADPEAADVAVTHEATGPAGGAVIEAVGWPDPIASDGGAVELLTLPVDDSGLDGGLDTGAVDVELTSLVTDLSVPGEPPSLGEYDPRSPPGDRLYWDVTGDGDVTIEDVPAFQEHLFTDAVQNNPEFFRFAGNDAVSHADVIALFQRAAGF